MASTPRAQREKLLAKQAAIETQLRRLAARERAQDRKADTRRKILAGAAVLDRAEKDAASKTELHQLLAGFLIRADDRALFELPPLPAEPTVASGTDSGVRNAA
jgi:hypothetical protein